MRVARLVRIGEVQCGECGYFKSNHLLHYEQPKTFKCPECGGMLNPYKRIRALLPGGFSNDFSSDCYWRPDKDCAAREEEWTGHRLECLEREGKIEKVDDHKERKAAIAMYKKHPEYFGDYEKGGNFEHRPQKMPDHKESGPTANEVLKEIGRVSERCK